MENGEHASAGADSSKSLQLEKRQTLPLNHIFALAKSCKFFKFTHKTHADQEKVERWTKGMRHQPEDAMKVRVSQMNGPPANSTYKSPVL